MSTDFEVACYTCKRARHLGQFMGGKYSFGFGTGDVEESARAAQFIYEHLGHDLRIESDSPNDFEWERTENGETVVEPPDTSPDGPSIPQFVEWNVALQSRPHIIFRGLQ